MSQGLSGSSGTLDGESTATQILTEQRVTNNLLYTLLGTSQAHDDLGTLRNDAAFSLGIPTPLPGAGR